MNRKREDSVPVLSWTGWCIDPHLTVADGLLDEGAAIDFRLPPGRIRERFVDGLLGLGTSANSGVAFRGRPWCARRSVSAQRERLQIGWVTGSAPFPANFGVAESFYLPFRFAGAAALRRAASEIAAGTGPPGALPLPQERPEALDAATRLRLSWAQALLMARHLLILEDPLSGLDMATCHWLRERVAVARAAGIAVVGILHEGEVAKEGFGEEIWSIEDNRLERQAQR